MMNSLEAVFLGKSICSIGVD